MKLAVPILKCGEIQSRVMGVSSCGRLAFGHEAKYAHPTIFIPAGARIRLGGRFALPFH